VGSSELGRIPFLFLTEFRDVVVIIWGVLSILLLLALSLSVLMLTFSVKRLIREVAGLIDADVKPVLNSARESVDNVAGTTRFIGEKAVTPIIHLIGLVSGLRRGIGVFTGLAGHRRGREDRP
jgi:hypothetical protein